MKYRIKKLIKGKNNKGQVVDNLDLETIVCKNCENEFQGNFCPECGQSVKEWNQPFSILIYDFMGTVLSFDTRFFRTLGTILFKPGRFSSDFMGGKRKKYMPPFQFYVFMSFIFFLLLNIVTSNLIKENMESDTAISSDSLQSDSLSLAKANTLELEINNVVFNSIEAGNTDSIKESVDELVKANTEPLQTERRKKKKTLFTKQDLKKAQVELEKQVAKPGHTETEIRIITNVIKMLGYPDVFMSKMFRFLSWSLFILMPVFGFWLFIFFRKSRKYYSGHFIYSLLVHATAFLILSLIIAIKLIFPERASSPENYLFWLIPAYIWFGMKKFYGRSIVRTSLKFLFVSFFYSISVVIAVAFVFVVSVYF